MSIQLTKQPAAISFSRNPVEFQLTSDARYLNMGKKFIARMQVTQPPAGYAINISYNNVSLDFTFALSPDDSGHQLPTRTGALSDEAYTAALVNALSANYNLSTDFDISALADGGLFYVRFAAKKVGVVYNISLTPQFYVGLGYLQTGENAVINPNFKLFYELWVQPAGASVPTRIGDGIYLETNDEGVANIDLSTQLTDALLKDGYDRPDFANAIAFRNGKSSAKFYLRYAEVYGEPQQIKKVSTTAIYNVQLGGISNEMLADFAFPGNFIAGDLLRFMRQEPVEKYLLPEQPEFLTLVLYSGAAQGVQLKFTLSYSDDTTGIVVTHALGDQPQYAKLTFPVGFVQNNLNLINDKAVIKYTVQVVQGVELTPLSEIRTYWLDYEYYAYLRYFVYLSSFGTYDTRLTFGRSSTQYELTQEQAEITTDKGFVLADGEQIIYSTALSNTETVTSGYKSKSEIRLFKDFALSFDQLLYRKRRTYAIAFASKTVKEFKDSDNLHAITFDIGFRYNEQLFTVDDRDDIDTPLFTPMSFTEGPVNPEVPDGSLDYRYPLKTEVNSKQEVEILLATRDTALTDYKTLNDTRLQAIELSLSDKAPAIHLHEGVYYTVADMQEILLQLQAFLDSTEGGGNGARRIDISPGDAELSMSDGATLTLTYSQRIIDAVGTKKPVIELSVETENDGEYYQANINPLWTKNVNGIQTIGWPDVVTQADYDAGRFEITLRN